MAIEKKAKSIQGITIAHFFDTYKARLKMELCTKDVGLHRIIREGSINRPSLALTGFFKYFANKRIQVFGAAEMTFFKSLSKVRQKFIMQGMIKRKIPGIVLTRNMLPPPVMLKMANEKKVPVFRTPMITMKYVNLATLCIDNEFAPAVTQHATTVDIRGVGVMIRGGSGVGKSECALALIERGHSLVADDVTVIKLLDERELTASSRVLNRGYIECRGIGIINVADMFGIRSVRLEKRIDMVVSLYEWKPGVDEERTGLEEYHYEILGMKVPHITLYVRPGRDMARLVEVAALAQALKRLGRDPAKVFNEQLIAAMTESAKEVTRTLQPTTIPAPSILEKEEREFRD